MAFFILPSPIVSILTFPSTMSLKAISGFESAIFSTTALTAIDSVTSFFKNFLLAGTLAKRFSTMTVVPSVAARSETLRIFPPLASSIAPLSAPLWREIILISETDAIAASASPRNPSVRMPSRSSAVRILLVACRRIATGRSSGSIPHPLSATRIYVTPPFCISTVIAVAPESIEFSSSSLMTEDGLSTTSPAAIRFATANDSTFILPIRSSFLPLYVYY